MKNKVLLGARYSPMEPMGLLYLSDVARQEGWEPKIAFANEGDFRDFHQQLAAFDPKVLGFTIYTGNHNLVFNYLKQLRETRKDLSVVLGGPHATYFPKEALKYADYVVLSEGFNSFRKILRGEAKPGIVALENQEGFPRNNDRSEFYRDHPGHSVNPIKSMITQVGCPYECTYCYNSSTLDSIASQISPGQVATMSSVLGRSGRLFPKSLRAVDDVVKEIAHVSETSPTKLIFFHDDVFGSNMNWLREFASKYPKGLPRFHSQTRFEYIDPLKDSGRERVDLLRSAGCNGVTVAIESASPIVRKEVLNRVMEEDLMFRTFKYLGQQGFGARTEQMLGLPCGATTAPTKINLDADLEILDLNVRLKRETGLPTIAWASIFAPYQGTKLGRYCQNHGFYNGDEGDIPQSFFEESVLNFPSRWVGPSLSPNNRQDWLGSDQLSFYRKRMKALRDIFSVLAQMPEGTKLAKELLKNPQGDWAALGEKARIHLYDLLYELA